MLLDLLGMALLVCFDFVLPFGLGVYFTFYVLAFIVVFCWRAGFGCLAGCFGGLLLLANYLLPVCLSLWFTWVD